MAVGLTVVKVGGSLFTLPDLRSRLQQFLGERRAKRVLLVPGGGPTADVIRGFDSRHGLGEETAHGLALRALTLNAHFLAALVPGAEVIADPRTAVTAISVLDAHVFCVWDEQAHPDSRLPHTWTVTSDAVAARAAVVGMATRLILLKSASLPVGIDWTEAGRLGFVDPVFADVIRAAPALTVHAVNFRETSGG